MAGESTAGGAVARPHAPSGKPEQPSPGEHDTPRRSGLTDGVARKRIAADLASTLFVEAGAGSGKTSTLVDRVAALVGNGAAPLRSIAAITFTDKAAAELRDRIRQRLEREATDAADRDDGETASRYRAGLDDLDGAAVGTLHSFAQRVLSEHPIEAGLPPRIDVLDEVSSDIAFDERWTTFRDELFDDETMGRTLLLLFATGVRAGDDALRRMAAEFGRNWDLVDDRVAADVPEPPDVGELVRAALAHVDTACGRRAECDDPDDKLSARLDEIAAYADRLRAIDDDVDLLDTLLGGSGPSFRVGNIGRSKCWPDVAAVRAEIAGAGEALEAVGSTVAASCARRIAVELRRFTLDAARSRQNDGRLEFHDLLVLARRLLRDPVSGPAVRAALHAKYPFILLDELQDTDPIQMELVVRIAAAAPSSPGAGSAPWTEVPVEPGHLFFVGDPKQSIYRFRRADLGMFMVARGRFGAESGGALQLTTNFRSAAPIVDWVNATFTSLMRSPAGNDVAVVAQPGFVALDADRRAAPPTGPAVSLVGAGEHPDTTSADQVRAAEAADVVGAVVRAVREGWSVGDGAGGWRPARFGDVAILVPARTSLPFLETALQQVGVAYRAESSSLVYATRAVRDLLMVVRAVDDPSDQLVLVSALRTPLFGCGDDDLARFRLEHGGVWSIRARQPATVPPGDPVRAALAYLGSLHESRHWWSPSELLDRIVADRRVLELGFADGRPRDVWRRVRFVVDQARAWADATGGTLRDYVRWVGRQTAEGARVAEAVLPETDDDAVRILTIHAAKGLEFPITVLSGMSTAAQARRAPAEVVFPPSGEPGYRFGPNVRTPEFVDYQPIDEQLDLDERIRLLYVAATRARDHLVVSVHRRHRKSPPRSRSKATNAELIVEAMAGATPRLGDLALAALPEGDEPVERGAGTFHGEPGRTHGDGGERPGAPPLLAGVEGWEAERRAMLRRQGRPTAVAATALSPEGTPDAGIESEAQPWAIEPAERVAGGDDRTARRPDRRDRPDPADPADTGAAGTGTADTDRPDPAGTGTADTDPADPADTGTADTDGPDPAGTGTADIDEPLAGVRKRPRDLDLPPWFKGRYGTAIGRAVHGVLQVVDLATGAGLDGAVAAQCEAEAVPDRAGTVRRLAEAALASPAVRAAAAAPHWREVYACTPVGDRLLEGYVDLLYRPAATPGLVVVDYKTAATTEAADLDRRVEAYRLQGAAYALAVAAATGEPVVRVTFVFLTPAGAIERDLTDLDATVAGLPALVGAGKFRTTD